MFCNSFQPAGHLTQNVSDLDLPCKVFLEIFLRKMLLPIFLPVGLDALADDVATLTEARKLAGSVPSEQSVCAIWRV